MPGTKRLGEARAPTAIRRRQRILPGEAPGRAIVCARTLVDNANTRAASGLDRLNFDPRRTRTWSAAMTLGGSCENEIKLAWALETQSRSRRLQHRMACARLRERRTRRRAARERDARRGDSGSQPATGRDPQPRV